MVFTGIGEILGALSSPQPVAPQTKDVTTKAFASARSRLEKETWLIVILDLLEHAFLFPGATALGMPLKRERIEEALLAELALYFRVLPTIVVPVKQQAGQVIQLQPIALAPV